MRRTAAWAVATLLAAAPTVARAQHVGTWTELPAPSSSTVGATVATGLAVSGGPHTYKVGVDYDYTLTGPLLLALHGAAALAGDGVGLHLAPGVRYLLPQEGLPWIPYGRAALAVDILGANVETDAGFGIGVKLGAGLQYHFVKDLAVGPELTLTYGALAGDGGSRSALAADVLIALSHRLP